MWYLYTNYIIGYNGNGNFVDILSYINNIQWTNDQDTISVQLTFDSILDLAEGRSHIVLKKDTKVVFQGYITKKINKDKTGAYTAMDYAYLLNRNDVEPIQFNCDAKTAIYQLLTKYNIGGACIPLATKISKLYKGKTVNEIIEDILKQCSGETGDDIIKEMRGNVLWIDKLSNLKIDCKYKISNDFEISRSLESMVNKVIVTSNEESDGSIMATAKDDSNINIFGLYTKSLSIEKANSAQSQNLADQYLNNYDATNREVTLNLTDIEGCEDIRAKRSIPVDISKYGVNGYFKVKSAQHNLSNNTHKIQVTIDFSNASFEEPALLQQLSQSGSSSSSSNSTSSDSSKQDQIISYAKQFLGVPYVWGGKTPSGFDCSGFVSYVFAHFGISLTPYTYTMFGEGTQVSLDNIQPCDLVFFFNKGHVAIYIGNNQFIEAPHTGANVRITTLSDYYRGECSGVVRVT
ncbi:C40 family peptidase [Clostridium sp. AWRP]|uniref:C40 family peptidase n=1 Tax=Clostridium sp. AWRP TaxID=2212991 RepID=UPI001A9B56C1|nr:C40 family peptidase [Clostridium sp. AWRP]